MALKRVEEPTAIEREFTFDFECFNITHRITTRGVNEENALARLLTNIKQIVVDINAELGMADGVNAETLPPKKSSAKKVVELKEVPATVSNGIVFNQPKKVNDPGFQPKFREEIN